MLFFTNSVFWMWKLADANEKGENFFLQDIFESRAFLPVLSLDGQP